jgi:ribonuclease P protein component
MTSGAEFTATVRSGRRAGRPLLVAHVSRAVDPQRPTLVGFVVARSVGDSVTRHRVTRRLRHQAAALLTDRPTWSVGLDVVVRALPAASAASSAELRSDLEAALDTSVRRLPAPVGSVA